MNNLVKQGILASIARYRAEGEAGLANLYGAGNDDFDGPAQPTKFAPPETLKALGVGSISPGANVISFFISNSHATDVLPVVLFQGYANATATNYGNQAEVKNSSGTVTTGGITITCDTIPYPQFLEQIKSNPIMFRGLRLVSGGQSPTAQLTRVMRLGQRDGLGGESSWPYNPSLRLSSMQNIPNIVDDLDFTFVAAGDSYVKFDVAALTTIQLILTVAAQTDVARTLHGKSALEVAQPAAASMANFNGRQ